MQTGLGKLRPALAPESQHPPLRLKAQSAQADQFSEACTRTVGITDGDQKKTPSSLTDLHEDESELCVEFERTSVT